MKDATDISVIHDHTPPGFDLEIKRLNLPHKVKWTCPYCYVPQTWHLDGDDLSHPMVNDWEQHIVDCVDCDEEASLELKLLVMVEVR